MKLSAPMPDISPAYSALVPHEPRIAYPRLKKSAPQDILETICRAGTPYLCPLAKAPNFISIATIQRTVIHTWKNSLASSACSASDAEPTERIGYSTISSYHQGYTNPKGCFGDRSSQLVNKAGIRSISTSSSSSILSRSSLIAKAPDCVAKAK